MIKKEGRLSNKICPDNMSVEEWQVALRRENAIDAGFQVEHLDENRIWGDYMVSSDTGRYRVAFRGVRSDRNFCSCLDFRTNGLGTCKHLEAVTLYLQQHVAGYPWAEMSYIPPYSSIYVSYKGGRAIKLKVGEVETEQYEELKRKYFDEDGVLPLANYRYFTQIENEAKEISSSFRCYDDVYELVNQELDKEEWHQDLENDYPDHRIPLDAVSLYDDSIGIEQKLFDLTYSGFGLIVSPSNKFFPLFMLRLAQEIFVREPDSKNGYIVLEDNQEVLEWEKLIRMYMPSGLPLEILTAQQFASHVANTTPECNFVFVDHAEGLKEWRNPVSMAMKKLSIKHLYMRIDTLQYLTPVQLSSILQHISPFVLGPFYKFIHTYRPIFPLKDDASTLPEEVKDSVYLFGRDLLKVIEAIVLEGGPVEDSVVNQFPFTAEGKAEAFLSALTEILADEEARLILLEKLKSL